MQALRQLLGRLGIQRTGFLQRPDAGLGAGGVDALGQRHAAHPMHQREHPRLLHVQIGLTAPQHPAPPARAVSEGVHHGGKARHHGIIIGQHAEHLPAQRRQQFRVAAHGVRIHEDRQIDQAIGLRQHQPLPDTSRKILHGATPGGIAQHHIARTGRIAETRQCLGKTYADRGQIVRGHIAVSQQQRVVLVGLQKLLAPPFAAHHQQTAVLHQFRRSNQLPGLLEETAVQILNQSCQQRHPRAAPILPANHVVHLRGRSCQRIQIGGSTQAPIDQHGMIRQETKQIQ